MVREPLHHGLRHVCEKGHRHHHRPGRHGWLDRRHSLSVVCRAAARSLSRDRRRHRRLHHSVYDLRFGLSDRVRRPTPSCAEFRAGAGGHVKIVDAKVIVCSPGRNFVTLKITTEDGIHGLGDATLNGRELAVASYLSDHVIPLLIGRDARKIEDIWQYLYKGAYWRRGPVTMASISAVDTALWDIKGKSLNVPVYQLLGG